MHLRGNGDRVLGTGADEHHLVAQGLHQPPSATGHDVRRAGLEGLHHLRDVLVGHHAGQPGEAGYVGEPHGGQRGFGGNLRIVCDERQPPPDGRGQVAPPRMHQQRLESGHDPRHALAHRGEVDRRLSLGQDPCHGVDLPVGQPGGRLPHAAHDLDRGGLVEGPTRDPACEQAQRLDVGRGEGRSRSDVGEAHGPPVGPRLLDGEPRGNGGLLAREHRRIPEDDLGDPRDLLLARIGLPVLRRECGGGMCRCLIAERDLVGGLGHVSASGRASRHRPRPRPGNPRNRPAVRRSG